MPVNGYSTYAAYLQNVNGFQRLQTSLATLTQQLNSGKKSSDLTTYGVETQRLVDLRAEIARRQGYMESIKSASTDVKAYDRVMGSIEDINATMLQAFTAPNTDPPTKQQHTITFSGDLGDVGDIYKVVVDGVLFSYVTNGTEGSYEEIGGNLAAQINNSSTTARATAALSGERLVITGTEPGPLFNIQVSKVDAIGGADNTIDVALSRAGKISPIIAQVNTALIELRALLNEQVNDRYLFGGINANEQAPVVDISRLPDPSGSKNSADSNTTTQLATGTIRQVVRITTDQLGVGQTETITVNGTPLPAFTGPLSQQQLAAAMAAAVGPLANVSVQDIDANGFTITADAAGTGFTVDIAGNDPTPSTIEVVQPNVPISADPVDVITLDGPIGVIGEVFSVTITDPPAHASPVTISYRTTGDEPDLNTIVDKLVAKIANHQPPFAVTPTNLGNGQLELRATTAFTSHATVQNTPTVATTQRTVVPVAQQDEIGFAGPYDAGDQYTITFTAPVGGPFTVTNAATDNEASLAAKFVSAINAAGIGVTASVRSGRLSIVSDTPGTPMTYTATLSTDVGAVSANPTTANVVANIPAGPLPQIDTVQLSGPLGRKGDVYEVTVNGRTVRYTTTGAEADMDAIAINLTALINAQVPAFPASAVPGVPGSGQLVLTAATVGVELETEAVVQQPFAVPDPTPTQYNVHQEATDSALAWQRSSIVIADKLSVKYTYSANEVAFQKLTLALRYAQSAVQDPDTYAEKMTIAKQLATDSLAGVRALQGDNAVNDALFAATTLSHQTTINANVSDSDKIEAVDPNEVAAKLQAVELQLQASFGAYSQISRLSLVNFIA